MVVMSKDRASSDAAIVCSLGRCTAVLFRHAKVRSEFDVSVFCSARHRGQSLAMGGSAVICPAKMRPCTSFSIAWQRGATRLSTGSIARVICSIAMFVFMECGQAFNGGRRLSTAELSLVVDVDATECTDM